MNWLTIKLCLILLSFSTICLVESRKEKTKLKDIQVLTLKPNQWTTGRRSKPVPQLQCVGGHCGAIKDQTVQCYNRGSDGVDVQWECKTQINNEYKFGSIDVICEGYDFANDDYVLIGSCGLEYTIDSVDPSHRSHSSNNDYSYSHLKSKYSNGLSFGFIVFAVILIFIIYYTCLRRPNSTPSDRRRTPGSPPPPGFRSDFFGGSDGSDGCSSSTGSYGYANQRTNQNANTGNGFFTGLFTGGTLGYLFGSRTTPNYRDQTSYFGRRTNSPYYSSGYNTRSSGSSTTTTTTSGFGGTKRR